MELNILISRKGTRVVRASELHKLLALADHHFQSNIRLWLKDVYQFSDAIRQPKILQDYARSPDSKGKLVADYYFSLELCRLIALHSKSKCKLAVTKRILNAEAAFPEKVQLSPEMTIELLHQTKAMSRMSCIQAAESRHLAYYSRRRQSKSYWNKYRSDYIVGNSMAELRNKLEQEGKQVTAKMKLSDLLLRLDPLELIRIGIADHYAAQGHSLEYANELGKLAKTLAMEMKLEITNDLQSENLFTPMTDREVLRSLQMVAA